MAGYNGYSKSNNAVSAEHENKFPATTLAKLLKVKQEAIKQYLNPCEWHHTSSYYNETNYYDGDIFIKIINNKDLEDYTTEEIKEAKILLNVMKNFKPVKPVKNELSYKANIEYIEWSGTRKHPKANVIKHENIDVVERGCFYFFKIGNSEIKKKIGGNGTFVNKMKGEQ